MGANQLPPNHQPGRAILGRNPTNLLLNLRRNETWVRKIIEEGFRIPFLSQPPVSTTKSIAYPLCQEAQEATEQEIHQLMIKRASISPVYRTEEEWSAQANSQSSQGKLSHSSTSFQDGVSASSLSHHSFQGLDDFHRANRRLSARFDQQGFSTVPSVRLGRSPVSIPRAPFWSVLIPTRLYQDPTPGPSLGSLQGHQNLGLLGRPHYSSLVQNAIQQTHLDSYQYASTPGLFDQRRQVRFTADTDPQAPGILHQHAQDDSHLTQGPYGRRQLPRFDV